jgi:hypothetical protein
VLQRTEASNALHQISALARAAKRETATDSPALRRLHIDYAHSISIGVHKEKYFLLMTLDGIDFTFCSATVDRTEPESLIYEFMTRTLTRLKIDCIRYDGVAEFAKSATFKAFCVNNRIAMEETTAHTHTFNALAEGAVRIVKEHVPCLLRRANLPRCFLPYAMMDFCRPLRRLIISSNHADIKSHAPPEKYFLGGCTYVCVCMCVNMTYDATIDTGGERNRV